MDNRFTTTDTGRPAPLWYQPTDGPRLYWTDEEWVAQQRLYRKGSDSADKEPVPDSTPQMIDRPRTCGHCKNTFYSSWPQAKTCGNPVCVKEYRKAMAKLDYRKNADKYRAAKRERDRKAKVA